MMMDKKSFKDIDTHIFFKVLYYTWEIQEVKILIYKVAYFYHIYGLVHVIEIQKYNGQSVP